MPLPALKFLFGPLALFDLFPRKTVSLLDLGLTPWVLSDELYFSLFFCD